MKTKNWVLTTVALGLAFAAAHAHAMQVQRAGSYYGSVNLGEYNTAESRNMDSPTTGGFDGGYNFTNYLAVQGGFNFFQPTDENNSNNSHKSVFGRLEGVFNLPTNTRFSPYFLGGLGWLELQGNHFAPDLGAGLRVFVSPKISFGLTYRHIFQLNPSKGDNMFTGAVSYYFGTGNVYVGPALSKSAPTRQKEAQKFRQESKYELPAGFPPCKTSGEVGCIRLVGNKATMNLDVKFAIDKSIITSSYQPQLNALGEFLQKYPTMSMQINGYTSNTGTYKHNQKLSDNRAAAVKKYLLKEYKVSPSRLTTKGWGWTHPVASNKSIGGRAENRRVEAVATVPLKPTVVQVPVTDTNA